MKIQENSLWRQACYINGEWIPTGENGIPVTNPVDDSVLGFVPRLGEEETKRAIAAAKAAWPAWRDLPARERGLLLRRWRDLVLENIEELAWLLTLEQGKPLAEARGEIMGGAGFLDWSSEECRRTYGETIPSPWSNSQPVVIKQSIGVAAAITPWNFPFALVARKSGPALGAGCPVIVKPATATPYVAIALAVLAERAGFPAGVFNVITGDSGKIGKVLTKSPDVRAFSFTGSTAVGKRLLGECADTVKKVALELGGNAPFIVYDDADLELAATQAHAGKARNAGQICVAPNRFFVQDGIYDAFVRRVTELAASVRLGDGTQPGVTQGPLIDRSAVEHMKVLVADAVARGAKVLTGGKEDPAGPNFFQYTILVDVTPEMRVFREEIFGPIMPVIRFSSEEEVIAMGNDTEYGLAAYLYTKDIGKAWRTAAAIESGIVGVNEAAVGAGEVPFGGMKESGLGREGGTEGLGEFMETKYILLGNLNR